MAVTRDSSAAGFMQLFWDLSSLNEEERIKSAAQLLKELQVAGLTLHKPCTDIVVHVTKQEGRADLEYCVARLVKGLASNRKGARHGYFTALCEVSEPGQCAVSLPSCVMCRFWQQMSPSRQTVFFIS